MRREDGGWGQDQQEKGRERWQNTTRRASLSRRGERPLAGVARLEHPRVIRPAPIPRQPSNSGGTALGPRPRHQVGARAPSHPRGESGLEVPRTGAGRVTKVFLATVPGKSRGLYGQAGVRTKSKKENFGAPPSMVSCLLATLIRWRLESGMEGHFLLHSAFP